MGKFLFTCEQGLNERFYCLSSEDHRLSKWVFCHYRPQTKFAKVMFLQVSVCPRGGACMVALGGHAWLLWGGVRGCTGEVCVVALGGGMHGCSWGVCVVALGGHVWLLQGGMHGCSWGGMRGCSWEGMCGCSRGGRHAWLLWGACVVAPGGHVWLLPGGCAWLLPGGACVVALGGRAWFFDEIWSMSGRYASYWNAFLFNYRLG